MPGEKRTFRRKSLKYPARLDVGDGQPSRECLLSDISETGARVILKHQDEIPDRVTLLIGTKGVAPRHCRVAWRDGTELGLEFKKNSRPPSRHFR
jgi:PilZ domain-containing protein